MGDYVNGNTDRSNPFSLLEFWKVHPFSYCKINDKNHVENVIDNIYVFQVE